MSLVSLSDAQERSGTAITQDMIDEVEEGWKAVIGPLVGERTETFFLSRRRQSFRSVVGLYLSRRTDAVTLTHTYPDASPTTLTSNTDFRLFSHYLIEREPAGFPWSSGIIEATYEPNDEEILRGVIFDSLTYSQTPVGLQSIRIGAYSETFFPSALQTDKVLGSLVRKILPAGGIGLAEPFLYLGDRRDRTLITGGDGS